MYNMYVLENISKYGKREEVYEKYEKKDYRIPIYNLDFFKLAFMK